jgi:two-component system chemotaxis response regulator CheB
MAAKIRVLVVEDSVTVRKRLVEVLGTDPEIEVAGEATDGKQAVELCLKLHPDVITMDMMLPVMSGLAATEQIMAQAHTPILIVSSSTNRGELFRTYDALAAGAVDVFEKPHGDDTDDAWAANFLARLKLVARTHLITHIVGRTTAHVDRLSPPARTTTPRRSCSLAALGASTGGPAALIEVLGALPPEFSVPVLVVLHIGARLGGSFADWLDQQIDRSVAFAVDGESLGDLEGRVIMAPPDRHLTVEGGRLRVSVGEERNACRPSVDVLFESVAREIGSGASACLLTGMGRDGAAGLLMIRKAGGFTIAQDEATSVMYGMPREAVRLGAAERVLPLVAIGPALAGLAAGPPKLWTT